MITALKSLFSKLKYYFSHEACYKSMEHQGIAAFGHCRGLVGGDSNTGHLQYACIDCKYFYENKRGDNE